VSRQPASPRSHTNPVGQTRRITRARRLIYRDIDDAQKAFLAFLEAIPAQALNAKFYEYQIDLDALRNLTAEMVRNLGNGVGARAAKAAAEAAYREGVVRAAQNLGALLDDATRAETEALSDAARAAAAAGGSGAAAVTRAADAQVQRRAALVGARVFEEMDGFAGQTGADLNRVLLQAVQSGENPRETAKAIRRRFDVSKTRAERIARTEITGALRRGRWDEARDTSEKLGMGIKLIHYSALIAGRTRPSHAERHGKTYTPEEVAAWYSQDANGINCLCSQSEVYVDESGDPIFGAKLLDRMQTQRDDLMGEIKKEEGQGYPSAKRAG
jgi:SPP1 gp7 family putative phage head morphogenesis protein